MHVHPKKHMKIAVTVNTALFYLQPKTLTLFRYGTPAL